MTLDNQITNRLLATMHNLDRASDVIFARFGMTATSHGILKHISAGLSTTTALAKAMDNTLGNITHKTKALEQSGYIQRAFDPADKRVWHFAITDDGGAALDTIDAVYQAALHQLYSEFSTTQKQQVSDFLGRVQGHLDRVLTADRPDFVQFVDQLSNKQGDK